MCPNYTAQKNSNYVEILFYVAHSIQNMVFAFNKGMVVTERVQSKITMACRIPTAPLYNLYVSCCFQGSKSKSPKAAEGEASIPALQVQSQRLDFQLTTAMYPRRLVRAVSKMTTPSSHLVHNCHSHLYFKVRPSCRATWSITATHTFILR